MVSTGINGFGRFGLHLLKYWLDRRESARFSIDYINDDFLSPHAAHHIILTDHFVRITEDHRVTLEGEKLTFVNREGQKSQIHFTNREKEQIPWRGKPDILLECSGKYSRAALNREYLEGATQKIIISATVSDADQTLIMGFNHEDYTPTAQIFSYGSCIINAFLPLTHWIHNRYPIQDCDTTIIHNIPEHQLANPGNDQLNRRACSLEWMGPRLVDYLTPDNFTVLKTYIPYPGISLIDMRYRLTSPPDLDLLKKELSEAFEVKLLKTLYQFDRPNQSPAQHLNSPYSAVLRQDGTRLVGENLYLSCYFDNENSVNRYFDLIQFMTSSSQ
jgi:glyceraldehyde 3-phosphate dehydrogenase